MRGAWVLQQFDAFFRSIALFAAVGVPAALVNSALKYMQKRIELAFQLRLTAYLHQQYCSNRAYYAASTLGGLSGADQRITGRVGCTWAVECMRAAGHCARKLVHSLVALREILRDRNTLRVCVCVFWSPPHSAKCSAACYCLMACHGMT